MGNRYQRFTIDDYFDAGGYPFLIQGIDQRKCLIELLEDVPKIEEYVPGLSPMDDFSAKAPLSMITKMEGLRLLQGLFAQLLGEDKFNHSQGSSKNSQTNSGNIFNNLIYVFGNGMVLPIPIATEINGLEGGDIPHIHNNSLIGVEKLDEIVDPPTPLVYTQVLETAHHSSLSINLADFSVNVHLTEKGSFSTMENVGFAYHACSGALIVKFSYTHRGELYHSNWKLEKTWMATKSNRMPSEEVILTLYGSENEEYVCPITGGIIQFPTEIEDSLIKEWTPPNAQGKIFDVDLLIYDLLTEEVKEDSLVCSPKTLQLTEGNPPFGYETGRGHDNGKS